MSDDKPREFYFNFKIGMQESTSQDTVVSLLKMGKQDFHVIEHQAYTDALKLIEEMAGALEFYSDRENWAHRSGDFHDYIIGDIIEKNHTHNPLEKYYIGGKKAREALESYRKFKGQ